MTVLILLHKSEGILLLPLTDTLNSPVHRHPRTDFIIDVKVCAMVTAD